MDKKQNDISKMANNAVKTSKYELEILKLKNIIKEQDKTIGLLTTELTKLKADVRVNSSASQDVTDEELICLQQLEELRMLSDTRKLTLEEIRMYDLLVKNKVQAQENSKMNAALRERAPEDEMSDEELLKLAAIPININGGIK